MAPVVVFYQACPVCGRSLRIPVQYFGRQVTCVHCGGHFRADDAAAPAASSPLPQAGSVPAPHALRPWPAADRR